MLQKVTIVATMCATKKKVTVVPTMCTTKATIVIVVPCSFIISLLIMFNEPSLWETIIRGWKERHTGKSYKNEEIFARYVLYEEHSALSSIYSISREHYPQIIGERNIKLVEFVSLMHSIK